MDKEKEGVGSLRIHMYSIFCCSSFANLPLFLSLSAAWSQQPRLCLSLALLSLTGEMSKNKLIKHDDITGAVAHH